MPEKKTANLALRSYVTLFILFSTRFLGLYSYMNVPLYYETFSIVSIIGVSLLYSIIILCKNHGTIEIHRELVGLFFSLILIVFVEVFNTSKINQGQSVFYTLIEASFYVSIPLIFFVFSNLMKAKLDFEWTVRTFTLAAIVLSCISIAQRLVYDWFILFPSEVDALRNGKPRIFIGGTVIFTIGFLMLIYNSLKNGVNWKNCIELTLCFTRIFWVEQQRAFSIILAVIFLLLLVKEKVENKTLQMLIFVSLLLLGFLGIAFSDVINNISSLLSGDISANARMWSINFFLKKAHEYLWFGMGFIGGTNDVRSSGYWLLRDSSGYLTQRSDVGIFGLLNMWGLIGVSWYFGLLHYFAKKQKDTGVNMASIMFLYTLLTSFTLILTDSQRVLLIPVFLTFVYQDRRNEKK